MRFSGRFRPIRSTVAVVLDVNAGRVVAGWSTVDAVRASSLTAVSFDRPPSLAGPGARRDRPRGSDGPVSAPTTRRIVAMSPTAAAGEEGANSVIPAPASRNARGGRERRGEGGDVEPERLRVPTPRLPPGSSTSRSTWR